MPCVARFLGNEHKDLWFYLAFPPIYMPMLCSEWCPLMSNQLHGISNESNYTQLTRQKMQRVMQLNFLVRSMTTYVKGMKVKI